MFVSPDKNRCFTRDCKSREVQKNACDENVSIEEKDNLDGLLFLLFLGLEASAGWAVKVVGYRADLPPP